VEGYVIDEWRNPEALNIAQSDSDRMARIRKITDEMRICRSSRTRRCG
jgi:hypothetical protein